jgi:RsiW-degrading membrane proteinase PrsW (M82 family)
VPRWIVAWLLFAGLSGVALLTAQLTHNWTVAPTAAFLGGISGPVALGTWLTDRTGIGRSARPDVLFVVAVAGGGFAIVVASVLEAQSFLHLSTPRAITIAVAEEAAKVLVPFAMATIWAYYRSPEPAVALAVAASAGFAAFESMTYALAAADGSLREARDVLFERSVITPFGHVPWTLIAVSVAATEWQRRGRMTFGPRALWGLLVAILLHATWNAELVRGGWWFLASIANGAVTFGLFIYCVRHLRYVGPYRAPPDRRTRR